ncbi:helix-turn-helix domain-containing protein [Paenibacillus sp. 7028]|nr:helix-turn-helix domain-containing protein [Paenibacillus apii]
MLFEKLTLKEQITRLYNSGMRQADIARKLKVHTNYVWKVVHKY